MNTLKYGIGIDMAMDKFDVCLSTIDPQQHVKVKAQKNFTNNPEGFNSLIIWVAKNTKEHAAPSVYLMEATGIYYEQLAWFLFKMKCMVSVVLPNKAKKYLQALGLRSKNDRIDAKGLSRMCCEQNHPVWKPLTDNIYVLRIVTRQIKSMTDHITALKNQLHALQYGMLRDNTIEKMYLKQIALFQKNKEQLQQRVEQIVQQDLILKKKFEQICKIAGLGIQTLAVIVAETNGFAGFQSISQLVSYTGYDVVENQSGKRKGNTRISKKGNSHIRRALFFPAFNVVKYQVRPFENLFTRVFERRKIKMKAYTAVQKKLLEIIYVLWKTDQPFDPNYQTKTSGEMELASSFTSTPKEAHQQTSEDKETVSPKSKVVPDKTRTTQDKHPSKNRRMSSFT